MHAMKQREENNFTERLDAINKVINTWSSRGLRSFIYENVTITKSLSIPKFVYVSTLLPTPKDLVSQLNRLLFKFLWNGTDKITRVPAIYRYDHGGLKMIDLGKMIVSLRLSWIKRVFSDCGGTWKSYLINDLERYRGLSFCNCNYDVHDYPSFSVFCHDLLGGWTQFRDTFETMHDWRYKNYFESSVICMTDIQFRVNNKESFKFYQKQSL